MPPKSASRRRHRRHLDRSLTRHNVVLPFVVTDQAGSTNEPMKAVYLFLLGEFELLPLIVGLVRYRRLGRTYRPFLLMLAVAVLNELVSYIVLKLTHSNSVPNNIYGLTEWMLIAWQFHVWGL